MVALAALAAPGPDRVALEMLEGREVSVTPNAGEGPVMLATRVADPGTWAVLVVWGEEGRCGGVGAGGVRWCGGGGHDIGFADGDVGDRCDGSGCGVRVGVVEFGVGVQLHGSGG